MFAQCIHYLRNTEKGWLSGGRSLSATNLRKSTQQSGVLKFAYPSGVDGGEGKPVSRTVVSKLRQQTSARRDINASIRSESLKVNRADATQWIKPVAIEWSKPNILHLIRPDPIKSILSATTLSRPEITESIILDRTIERKEGPTRKTSRFNDDIKEGRLPRHPKINTCPAVSSIRGRRNRSTGRSKIID